MENTTAVKLEHFKNKFLDELNHFELSEEQLQFSSLPKDSLNNASGRHPIVITNYGRAVGFFLLHLSDRVKNYSSNPKALLLTALAINQKYQGKGFAKQGMLALPYLVKENFSTYNEVILVVDEKNLSAKWLYEKAGFKDTGERRNGRIGQEWLMSLSIE
ncbi:GNAT family N-acetyltransferase [Cytobacillus purgationiresistens]|uniref:RimJ/RimL family protein N-acetyltransferase n=1 Tax=Cytobacillus purgationiresistens TaxID=863449 RepID=A0ABU0AA64_9BACI|nr:GNAT family N-acetyltransferase [Cytobacillus purgationiresistens]MDQ0268141.1 RimJ/RimL family protein N-acetyltransferase [Cytobacillus purgationiresistens]